MTPAEAQLAYVEEFAAESRDLMRRALVYAAQKRADEYQRAMGIELRTERHTSRTVRDEPSKPATLAPRVMGKPQAKRNRGGRGRDELLYEHDGLSKTLAEWAKFYGVSKAGLYDRLYQGMTFANAVEKTQAWEARQYPGGRPKPSTT